MKKKIIGCSSSKRISGQDMKNLVHGRANRRMRYVHKKICRRAQLGETEFFEPVIATGYYG